MRFCFLVLGSVLHAWRPADARFLIPVATVMVFPPPFSPSPASRYTSIALACPLVFFVSFLRPCLSALLSSQPPLFALIPMLGSNLLSLFSSMRAFFGGGVMGSCQLQTVGEVVFEAGEEGGFGWGC